MKLSGSKSESIGAPGFEPGTSPTRTVRATRLRHAPRAQRSLAATGRYGRSIPVPSSTVWVTSPTAPPTVPPTGGGSVGVTGSVTCWTTGATVWVTWLTVSLTGAVGSADAAGSVAF